MNNIARYLLAVIVATLCSCSNSPKDNEKETREIDRDGMHIDYDDSKGGDTVLLFIHGWGINRTYWANQTAYFAKRYRVVALDLPGFGQSGKNRKTWTVEEYGKDVSTLLNTLDLKNVVLIGHSMSGAIAVESALTNPSRVIGIVGVDNFNDVGIVVTPQMEEAWSGFYQAARKDFKKTISQNMDQVLFAPSTDSTIRKRVMHDILSADSIQAMDCLEDNGKYPLTEKLKATNKTLYLVNSHRTQIDTLAFQKNEIGYYLLDVGMTGHYPMLEDPDRFNALLQKALDKMKRTK